jgi:hypothetical protein
MEITVFLILLVSIILFIAYFDRIVEGLKYITGKKKPVRNPKGQHDTNVENMEADATQIIESTLKDLGCNPVLSEEGALNVCYQGEHFHIRISGPYVSIWDPGWYITDDKDPNLLKLREAANNVNLNYFGTRVLLSENEEDGSIRLHSRRDIMLHSSLPKQDQLEYVQSVMESFFQAKRAMHECYEEIDVKQAEKQKERRPIGFALHNNKVE